MNKKVNILEAQDFQSTGKFFYCTDENIQSWSKEKILEWFSGAEKITFENEGEFTITSIEPMISFTNKAAVLIKVDTQNIPKGIYPVTATIH